MRHLFVRISHNTLWSNNNIAMVLYDLLLNSNNLKFWWHGIKVILYVVLFMHNIYKKTEPSRQISIH